MKKIIITACVILMPFMAHAEEMLHYGITVDFMPFIMYAETKKPGYSFQIWTGAERVRMRMIAAHMHLPDQISKPGAFTDHSLTVSALVFDLFRNEKGLTGFWAGSGIELWQNSVKHDATGERYYWTSQVATLGGGYIFKFSTGVFIEPWAAVHYIMNPQTVSAGSDSYTPRRLSGEVSLKTGIFL